MLKIYQGYSRLAFNVKMESGYRRIVFDGQTNGFSIYSTRDVKEQKAIESHYLYNDKFWLEETIDEKKLEAEAKKRATARAKKVEEEKKKYVVTDIADAKEYLADTYGVSRTMMKTKEDVLNYAAEFGVELEGLE